MFFGKWCILINMFSKGNYCVLIPFIDKYKVKNLFFFIRS